MTQRKIESADNICALVARQADVMRLLRSVEELALPDCWIGAGFIRNAIWDALHGRTPNCALLNDVSMSSFLIVLMPARRSMRQLKSGWPRAHLSCLGL